MAIILNTNIPLSSGLNGSAGEPLENRIFVADFRTGRYLLGDGTAAFADLFTYARAEVVNYFDPISNAITASPAGSPIFFDPRGRRGLYLSSVQGALLAGLPTAAGSSSHTYAANRNGASCILEVFGAPGAKLTVSGDLEATHEGGVLTGGRFKHIYLTLRASSTRIVDVAYNGAVRAWKLSLNPFEEFGGVTFNSGSNTAPSITATGAVLSGVNSASVYTVRGRLRVMGHRGAVGTWGKTFSIEDASGNGLQFSMLGGVWTLISTQAVATGGQGVAAWTMPVSRYLLAEARSEDLEFTLRIDKAARKAHLRTAAGRDLPNIPLPVMGNVSSIKAGAHGGNTPKVMLDYITAHAA